jgi:DNA-binding NarL/FixJ family response regulator
MLTQQELRILGLVCDGLCNKQIAQELGLSQSTVEKRRASAMSCFPENRRRVVQYVLRHASKTIKSTHADQLTPRQLDLVSYVAGGLSNSEIAHAMQISVSTVEKHISGIFLRTMFRNRFQIIIWGLTHNNEYMDDLLNEGEATDVV